MDLFWSGATPVFSSVPCPMTRLLKTVTRAQTLLKMQKFPLTGKVLKLQIFPLAGNSGPSEQQNGGGIVLIPPPRSLRRVYAVSCKETKNPNPLPMANRFGFLDFGTPEGTRTPSLQNRNLTLYPIALRARFSTCLIIIAVFSRFVKRKISIFSPAGLASGAGGTYNRGALPGQGRNSSRYTAMERLISREKSELYLRLQKASSQSA